MDGINGDGSGFVFVGAGQGRFLFALRCMSIDFSCIFLFDETICCFCRPLLILFLLLVALNLSEKTGENPGYLF